MAKLKSASRSRCWVTCILQKTGNVPTATGARGFRILGKFHASVISGMGWMAHRMRHAV